MAVIMKLVG